MENYQEKQAQNHLFRENRVKIHHLFRFFKSNFLHLFRERLVESRFLCGGLCVTRPRFWGHNLGVLRHFVRVFCLKTLGKRGRKPRFFGRLWVSGEEKLAMAGLQLVDLQWIKYGSWKKEISFLYLFYVRIIFIYM